MHFTAFVMTCNVENLVLVTRCSLIGFKSCSVHLSCGATDDRTQLYVVKGPDTFEKAFEESLTTSFNYKVQMGITITCHVKTEANLFPKP